MQRRIFIFLFFIFIFSCKNDTTTTNPYLALLIGSKTPYSPVIYSIEPRKGNPVFSTPATYGVAEAIYDPTVITIKGKNFVPSTTGNTVVFHDVQATVDFASETELIMKVPKGAKSGVLSVANNGGVCNSFDKKGGINCHGQDFYIDCYGAYNGAYGAETTVETGTDKTIAFNSVSTKPFRSDLLATNPYTNEQLSNKISISCTTLTRVLYFSQACEPTEHVVNGTSIVFNPIISLNTAYYTIQYLVTAGKGDCTIRVN